MGVSLNNLQVTFFLISAISFIGRGNVWRETIIDPQVIDKRCHADSHHFTAHLNTKVCHGMFSELVEWIRKICITVIYCTLDTHYTYYFIGQFTGTRHYINKNSIKLMVRKNCKMRRLPSTTRVDMTIVWWCIGVCNPINHIAGKTLGNTSRNTAFKSESIQQKINWFVYIFADLCLGSLPLLYCPLTNFSIDGVFTAKVSSACGQLLNDISAMVTVYEFRYENEREYKNMVSKISDNETAYISP